MPYSSFRIAPIAPRDIPALDRKLANFTDANFSKILVEHEHIFIFKREERELAHV